jgi:hypothetical protein
MNLVTAQEVKDRVRAVDELVDADLELAIAGASTLVLRHLGDAANEFLLDGDGVAIPEADVEVPADVQNATLMMVGVLLRDPDGADGKDWDPNCLPRPVTALLASRRVPPLA